MVPEDSASAQVSPTNKVTNSLDALTLIHDKLANNEDVIMDEERPQGFKEALQSFQAWMMNWRPYYLGTPKPSSICLGNWDGRLQDHQQVRQRWSWRKSSWSRESLTLPPPLSKKWAWSPSLWRMMRAQLCLA